MTSNLKLPPSYSPTSLHPSSVAPMVAHLHHQYHHQQCLSLSLSLSLSIHLGQSSHRSSPLFTATTTTWQDSHSHWVPQVAPAVSLRKEEECVIGGGIGKVHRWWVSFLVGCGGLVFLSSSLSHLTLYILELNLKRI